MQFTWKEADYTYTSGENLYLKNLKVGTCFWSVVYKEDREKPYKISTTLPFNFQGKDRFKTLEEGKEYLQTKIERLLTYLTEK